MYLADSKSVEPYSLRNDENAGSASAGSVLRRGAPVSCKPENSLGRNDLAGARFGAAWARRTETSKAAQSATPKNHFGNLEDMSAKGASDEPTTFSTTCGLRKFLLGRLRRVVGDRGGDRRVGLLPGAGHLDATQPSGILGNSTVERLGNLLAIATGLELVLVARVTDKGNLCQDGRHVGTDEHHKWGLLYAAIAQIRTFAH